MKRLLCMLIVLLVAKTNAQNVGIGTLTPAARLDVKTTSN